MPGIKTRNATKCVIGLLIAVVVNSTAAARSSLVIVNHAATPVPNAAIHIPADQAADALGSPIGTPFEAVGGDGSVIPFYPVQEQEKQVLRAYVSLAPGERKELTLRSSEGWGSNLSVARFDAKTQEGSIANGLLKLDYRGGRWILAYAGTGAEPLAGKGSLAIIERCHLDAWLDTEQRGRLMGADPKSLGLIHVDGGRLTGGEARVQTDGSVTLTLTKEFDGAYKDVVLTETFTLVAGKPLLRYDPVLVNRGSSPRYLAYVNLGGALRGHYGELMQAEPMLKYEDPRSAKPILLSGNANSFTRIAWRSEACWVGVGSGRGFGVGFSTVEKINRTFIGSTVWDFSSKHAFVACLLQATHEAPDNGVNFPMLIPPDGALRDIGLAMVTSSGGVDIRNQTRDLFKAVMDDRLPPIAGSLAVYLNDKPLQLAEVQGFDNPAFLTGQAGAGLAALEMDFTHPFQLTAHFEQASTTHPVTVTARSLAGERQPAVMLMKLESPTEKTVDFTALTGWLGSRQKFLLEVQSANHAVPSQLTLAPMPLVAPVLSSPADKLSLTDVAVFYRWKGVPGALDYEIQMARNPTFSDPVTIKVRSEIEWPMFMPDDDELPAPGTWYWRVRGLKENAQGVWSETRSMTVDNKHTKAPLMFRITPEHPLFTFEGFRIKDWSKFKDTIPEDLRPYVAFNTGEKFDLIEHLRPLHEQGQRVFIRTHHPSPISGWCPLADVEEAFQKYPNVMGIMGGETLSVSYDGSYANRLLKLCGKYGRIFYEADGTYPGGNKWEELYHLRGDLMRDYRDYLVFAQKNNILHRQFVSQSSVLGLYLSGAISNQGAWEDGGWYWQQVGFRKLGGIHGQRGGDVNDMPSIFYSLNFIMGLSRGCAVFSLEGQTGVANVGSGYRIAERGPPQRGCPSAYYTTEGELTPSFVRYTEPLIRAVVKRKLVPTRDQILAQTRLAVYNDGVPMPAGGDPYYFEWETLYRNTYGFRDVGVYPGTLMEFFPNTGRYHYIPVFPQGRVDLKGVRTLPLSQLMADENVRSVFDEAYPSWYEGDALVQIAGDTMTVLNSHENTDESERYSVPLRGRGTFLKMMGRIEPHSYLIGKFENGNRRLWLQANTEYAERDTKLMVQCARPPTVKVTPASAVKLNEWRDGEGILALVLSHVDGAVEVEINDNK